MIEREKILVETDSNYKNEWFRFQWICFMSNVLTRCFYLALFIVFSFRLNTICQRKYNSFKDPITSQPFSLWSKQSVYFCRNCLVFWTNSKCSSAQSIHSLKLGVKKKSKKLLNRENWKKINWEKPKWEKKWIKPIIYIFLNFWSGLIF